MTFVVLIPPKFAALAFTPTALDRYPNVVFVLMNQMTSTARKASGIPR